MTIPAGIVPFRPHLHGIEIVCRRTKDIQTALAHVDANILKIGRLLDRSNEMKRLSSRNQHAIPAERSY